MKKSLLIVSLVGVMLFSGCSSKGADKAATAADNKVQATQTAQATKADENVTIAEKPAATTTADAPKASAQTQTNTAAPAATTQTQPAAAPAQTQPAATAPKTTATTQTTTNTQPAKTNEFVRSQPDLLLNSVSITPSHVYYNNGTLVMDAFIVNGFDYSVFNLTDIKITLKDKNDQVIAQAYFDANTTIAAKTYIPWKFNFGSNLVKINNADLSYLKWDSTVNFSH